MTTMLDTQRIEETICRRVAPNCGNKQVSKRDIIASVNANYYRVIESINKSDSTVKINNDYNYKELTLLFNRNKTSLDSIYCHYLRRCKKIFNDM